ncbi:MAG: helix-turn-helix domain-containing protein [Erysipelotrichaceae bacterium]|nr:helix-turn-helix domain-containing protein [Erysipelotrichaceae bacterium]
MLGLLHNRAEVTMYEEYPMIHYEFESAGTGMPVSENDDAGLKEKVKEAYSLVMNADYRLRGYVDVLPSFPHPDDAFHKRMHLQAFSHMYSMSDYYTNRKDVPSWQIVYTHSGSGRLEYRNHSVRIGKGDLFWIDCREESSYRTDGEYWDHTDIHINGEGISELFAAFGKRGSAVIKNAETAFFETDVRALLDACVTPDTHRTLRICHSIETMLVHLVLADSRREGGTTDHTARLHKLVYFMHDHFREPLSMDQLSDISGFSKYHLSREFRKLTGFAPNEYLIRLRIEQAKLLLVNTTLPVYQVARMSGIDNEAYFSRLFHQRMHMTPAQYRRKNRAQ